MINDPAIGPDSYTGYLVSTLQGCTETTFYVLAVYFGAVGVDRMRHAVVVGLAADAVGVLASVFICEMLFGRLNAFCWRWPPFLVCYVRFWLRTVKWMTVGRDDCMAK